MMPRAARIRLIFATTLAGSMRNPSSLGTEDCLAANGRTFAGFFGLVALGGGGSLRLSLTSATGFGGAGWRGSMGGFSRLGLPRSVLAPCPLTDRLARLERYSANESVPPFLRWAFHPCHSFDVLPDGRCIGFRMVRRIALFWSRLFPASHR